MNVSDSLLQRITDAIALQQSGGREEARSRFASLWNEIQSDGAPLHRCVLAHYMADLQDDPQQELWWDLQALEGADLLMDHHVQHIDASLTIAAFYPSLHLNLAEDYRRLGEPSQARRHLAQAEQSLTALPDDGYAQFVRQGVARLAAQLAA